MPINTTLAGLSTNPALNGPDGSTDLPSSLDDAIRYALSFTAQLRDGIGFTAGAIVAGLGYTPVQSGTGTLQVGSAVKIGWSVGGKIRLQVDATDFADVWPMSISGNAATATTATNATNATNSGAVGGVALADLVRRNSLNDIRIGWSGAVGVLSVDGTPQNMQTTWTAVTSRPTAVSQFTNDLGFITSAYAVQKENSVASMGNLGTGGMFVRLNDATVLNWGVTISDARLKENIRPSVQDSLAKVRALSFKSFNFKPGHDDGREHKAGLIAQDLEALDPELVDSSGTWKQPRVWELLCVALHAVQQLEARVAVLEGKA